LRRAYRAVAEEDAIRVEVHDLACWVVGWNHSHFAAKGCQSPQDVVLAAKVKGDDLQPSKHAM